jgi:hypothetical protein
MTAKNDRPSWLPHRGLRIRWDRSLAIGDSNFRWHTRLDGSAILHGPEGKLAVGDSVDMPVGHLHREGNEARVAYVVAEIHADEGGHVWIKAVRR